MQAAQAVRLVLSTGGTGWRVAMSEIASLPPGFSTRCTSRSARRLSGARLTTQLLMTTSTEASGSGIDSISPFRNSTLAAPMRAAFADPAFWSEYEVLLRDYVGRPSPIDETARLGDGPSAGGER